MKQQQQSTQQQPSTHPAGQGQLKVDIADPEVKIERRRYSRADKERILAEADCCRQPGEIGALLRREGLYSSHLSRWRAQRGQGELSQAAGPGRRQSDPQEVELRRLQQENERLKRHLSRAEVIIEAQKKLCQLLNLPLGGQDED